MNFYQRPHTQEEAGHGESKCEGVERGWGDIQAKGIAGLRVLGLAVGPWPSMRQEMGTGAPLQTD